MPFHRRFADRAGSAPATALNLTREKGYLSASFVLALSCCTSQGRTPRIIACHLSGRPRWLPVQIARLSGRSLCLQGVFRVLNRFGFFSFQSPEESRSGHALH